MADEPKVGGGGLNVGDALIVDDEHLAQHVHVGYASDGTADVVIRVSRDSGEYLVAAMTEAQFMDMVQSYMAIRAMTKSAAARMERLSGKDVH